MIQFPKNLNFQKSESFIKNLKQAMIAILEEILKTKNTN